MQEYLIAKQTVEHILGIDRKKKEEKRQNDKKLHYINFTTWAEMYLSK